MADDAGFGSSVREDVLVEVALEEAVRIEVERIHLDLTVERMSPFRAGSVGVELDAVAFGVGEVEGLADQVIAGADEGAVGVLRGVGDRGCQGFLGVEQERGMEEPGLLGVDAGQARGSHEFDQGSGAATEHAVDLAVAGGLLEGLHCEGVRVVVRHLLEIADAQSHGVHSGGGAECGVIDGR